MRTPDKLSYSSFSLWEKNPEEFYLKYLADNRPPRVLQDHPASVDGAFDANVKAALLRDLGGTFNFDELFEAQVEPQNRDWARPEGDYVFDGYWRSGFYDELLSLLSSAQGPPRFEFTVEAAVNGVPVVCKPDLRFVTAGGIHVIHDWKVNGYCSKSATSPNKAYMLCRDAYVAEKQSKSHNTEHNQFLGFQHGDLTINKSYMEAASESWADQLSLYGWALGEKIGDENVVVQIHQTVAKPMPVGRPQLRIAQYRARVKRDYQLELAARLKRCWDAVQSGHIFTDMSREENDGRIATLNKVAVGLASDGSDLDRYFNETTRDRYRG